MTTSGRRITKLLVANRGEIARRVFRTARSMGIATVAVFTEPDRHALFVGEADEAVALGPGPVSSGDTPYPVSPGDTPYPVSPGDTPYPGGYLDVEALLAAARRTGAGAVHPGYGFLAEDAHFAWRCAEAGLLLVGPPAEVIATMGSKLEAKEVAARAGVPILPAEEIDGYPPAKVEAAAELIGWPVLVKASAGGGGRGMRVVHEGEDLLGAVESARREAAAAFGDGTVFLEAWLEAPRHVEVQVVGDAAGRVGHLFERDCSIQRRHQKVIEEAPAPRLPARLREDILAAAVSLAQAVGYVGAGTVELLVAGERFYFLEMNTRLQVEHPVTECILGLDLVRLQLLVAEGRPLPEAALHPEPKGHAIEARLYAEDPRAGFLPQSGRLRTFEMEAGPGLRIDTGVASGSVVGPDYDPMLAKVVAHAPTRSEAARRLAGALAGMRLHGLRTNRDLLVRTLRHPEFLAGEMDTGFLERHREALLEPLAGPDAERLHAVAAALAAAAGRREAAPVLRSLPAGWRNNPSRLEDVAFETQGGRRIEVGYRFDRSGGVAVEVDGQPVAGVRVDRLAPEEVDLEVEGLRRRFSVARSGSPVTHDVDSSLGHSELVEVERFPLPEEAGEAGSLTAPLAGVVVRVAAKPGATVETGDLLVAIESMKVEYRVTAPEAGRVTEVRVEEGERVEAGAVLVVLEVLAPDTR
jgi:propionyl-CoA carboxylase alpha chain